MKQKLLFSSSSGMKKGPCANHRLKPKSPPSPLGDRLIEFETGPAIPGPAPRRCPYSMYYYCSRLSPRSEKKLRLFRLESFQVNYVAPCTYTRTSAYSTRRSRGLTHVSEDMRSAARHRTTRGPPGAKSAIKSVVFVCCTFFYARRLVRPAHPAGNTLLNNYTSAAQQSSVSTSPWHQVR